MDVLWFGGNHPRHLYFAQQLHRKWGLSGAVVQDREKLVPDPPQDLPESDQENYRLHFRKRQEAEERYFSDPAIPDCPTHEISRETLNSEDTVRFASSVEPDVVFVFGCGLLREPVLGALPGSTVNLHLGLSPKYRGGATLFWPFYFLEPAFAGSTFHHLTSEPDAGEVVHQVTPELDREDGIHDVACKTVLASVRAAVRLTRVYQELGEWKRKEQSHSGKLFFWDDFRAEHLRLIYDVYDDRIVECYLEGEIQGDEPDLFHQFPVE